MILQIVNIAGGALVASPFIKEKMQGETIRNIFESMHPYETKIGVGMGILGLIALIERLGILSLPLPLGSSFPQALPLLLSGLLLGSSHFSRFAVLRACMPLLEKHKILLGGIAILSGLGSLLFGCIAPLCYPLYIPFF